MTQRRGQAKIAGTGFRSVSGVVMVGEATKDALKRILAKGGYRMAAAKSVSSYQDYDGVNVDVFNLDVKKKDGSIGQMTGTVFYTSARKLNGQVKNRFW